MWIKGVFYRKETACVGGAARKRGLFEFHFLTIAATLTLLLCSFTSPREAHAQAWRVGVAALKSAKCYVFKVVEPCVVKVKDGVAAAGKDCWTKCKKAATWCFDAIGQGIVGGFCYDETKGVINSSGQCEPSGSGQPTSSCEGPAYGNPGTAPIVVPVPLPEEPSGDGETMPYSERQ
jgi:hypothetical protein